MWTMRTVTVGINDGNTVQILQGLNSGRCDFGSRIA
jgi:hypothetical protein